MKRLPLILISLVVVTSLEAASSRIARIVILNGHQVPSEEIRRVLPIQEGDPFDNRKLEQALRYLKLWGRFREVGTEKRLSSQGWILTFHLVEGPMIGSIHISGNYPYLSRRLRRRIALHPGEIFDPKNAAAQAQRLIDFYEREGYFGTEVKFFAVPDRKKDIVDLHYHLKKGRRYRIGEITLVGNTLLPRGYLVSAINPLRPYHPSRLRQSLEKIEGSYRQRGYYKARVRLENLSIDPVRKEAHLTLHVREGEQATILFRGNRMVKNRTFKRIIPIIAAGDTSSLGVDESAQLMEQYLKDQGFLSAKVRGERIKKDTGDLVIVFDIHEGIQTEVKKIAFRGNKSLSGRKIKKSLETVQEGFFEEAPLRPQTIERDFKKLPEIFLHWGFFEARALKTQTEFSPLRDKVTVTFTVEENAKGLADQVRIEGNEAVPTEKLRDQLKMKKGSPLHDETVKKDREALKSYLNDRGYTYAEVNPEIVRREGTTTLTYRIQEGEKVRVGEILPVGNRRTRRKAIEQYLNLKRNGPFSLKRFLKSESSLRRPGVFRSVDIDPMGLAEKEETIHLLVKMEENPSFYIDLESSYDTDNRFVGSAVLQSNNLFGHAKRGVFRLTGGQDIQKGELDYIDPRLAGLDLTFSLGGLFAAEQRPGFSTVDAGGHLTILREFTPRTTLLGKYQLNRTFFRGTSVTEKDNTTSKLGLSFAYDSRDSFSDPKRGLISVVGMDVSNKIIASGFDFLSPSGSIAHYHSFKGRFTLLNYVRVQGIKVFGGDVLTKNQRLFLGGDYSVRGFGQDEVGPLDVDGKPAGGQLLFLHTAELQMRILRDFKVALFIDSGSLTDTFSQVGLPSWRHSAGGGLRYVTPIGPLRLDYGFKLDRLPGEEVGRLHFVFGYAF